VNTNAEPNTGSTSQPVAECLTAAYGDVRDGNNCLAPRDCAWSGAGAGVEMLVRQAGGRAEARRASLRGVAMDADS
jgi:hypothetical protein